MVAIVAGTFLALTTSFSFVGFALFFPLAATFAFGGKSISTASRALRRHVPVLIEEVLLKKGESALYKGGIDAPSGDMCINLGPRLNYCKEVVDACEFRNVVTGVGKELVVLRDGTAEVTGNGEMSERGQVGVLGCVNLVFGDGAEHDLEFANEFE